MIIYIISYIAIGIITGYFVARDDFKYYLAKFSTCPEVSFWLVPWIGTILIWPAVWFVLVIIKIFNVADGCLAKLCNCNRMKKFFMIK